MNLITYDLEINKHIDFNNIDFNNNQIENYAKDIKYYIKRKGYCKIRFKYHEEIDIFVKELRDMLSKSNTAIQVTELKSNVIKINFVEVM